GLALETLKRESQEAKPANGATASAEAAGASVRLPPLKASPEAKKELVLMQGEWSMQTGINDGNALPDFMTKTGRRIVKGDEVTVTVGGQVMMMVRISLDPTTNPKSIDY